MNQPSPMIEPSPGKNPGERFLFWKQISQWYEALPSEKKQIVLWSGWGIGILLFIFINILAYQYGSQLITKKPSLTQVTPTPTPTPTPIPFKHKGKMNFSVSTNGSVPGPKITQCNIDPLDFTTNKTQVFQVRISSESPVQTASVIWKSDTKEEEIPLVLVSGTETKGVWEVKKTVTDTAWYRYELVMKAYDGTHTREITLTLR